VNRDIEQTMEYHEATKHSEVSVQLSHHYLDWDNKPLPFKVYTKLPSILLPKDFSKPQLAAFASISGIKPNKPSATTTLDTKRLAEILFFSAGITREMKYPFGTYYMRAASATGALYPIELYIVCKDIIGLKAGIYHFCPGDFTLTELRLGDYRFELATAAGDNKNIITSPVTIVFTSIAWRNAWKYQARSYRHWFWDTGVIAANLLATAISAKLPAQLIIGFVDDIVNQLLFLDVKREVTVAIVPIGIGSAEHVPSEVKEAISPSNAPEVVPLSKKREVEYPEIMKAYESSKLLNNEEVKSWVKAGSIATTTNTNNIAQDQNRVRTLGHKLLEYKEPSFPQPSLGEVILMRGSTRRFTQAPISFTHLSNILSLSTRGVPLDFLKEDGDSIVDVYLIANDITGLQSGSYFFNRTTNSLDQLKGNSYRSVSGYLCLNQSLFSDASVVFFLMSDLQLLLKALGNRGYRASQLEAGVIAGKIYLSAYAQGLGASGSTFYDDAVTEFFSPHAKDKSTMIAVGVGIPGYKARSGKVLAGITTRTQLLKKSTYPR
jgi:SagB-type dehydrogenase family enzyme